MPCRPREADAGADCSARRQQEPDPYRLDDRLGSNRDRRHSRRRQTRPRVPQGRVGLKAPLQRVANAITGFLAVFNVGSIERIERSMISILCLNVADVVSLTTGKNL